MDLLFIEMESDESDREELFDEKSEDGEKSDKGEGEGDDRSSDDGGDNHQLSDVESDRNEKGSSKSGKKNLGGFFDEEAEVSDSDEGNPSDDEEEGKHLDQFEKMGLLLMIAKKMKMLNSSQPRPKGSDGENRWN